MDRSGQVTELAREYRSLMARGDVISAEQVRRTIDDCGGAAGRYEDGRWTLHAWVLAEMGVVQS
jgi:hypothetical protein